MNLPLIVLSHLCWDFVYQRPQHLMSRLARHHPVYFVQEPRCETGAKPRLDIKSCAEPGVTVLQPVTALDEPGWTSAQWRAAAPLLAAWRARHGLGGHIAWLYTPMAMPALAGLQPAAMVYDCMDELSKFKGAPAELPLFERDVMRRADLILTGGPSLYEAKRRLHPNTHCLPSSVDAAHYAPEWLDPRTPAGRLAHALQGGIAGPRLGYFGVIDERLDLDLVDKIAEVHPDWQVMMVGPLAKIDASALPEKPNLHWLGLQDYAVLPHLVNGWDVCIMPFALNEHTRFISPTKTLEYLAASKPVVSTPIRDVVAMYRDAVSVASDTDRFIAACEKALADTPAARRAQRLRAAATVSRYSWDATAARAEGLIAAVLGGRTPTASTEHARVRRISGGT